ncbi:MAG: class I SAM-dependent methyltransferase [Caldilineaceae bacterium]
MIEIRHRAIHEGQSIQDAYDELYLERTLIMRDSFYLWLLELLQVPHGGMLVDVACGNGRLVELAAAQGTNAVGLELSWTGIARAVEAEPRARWLLANGQQIPLDDGSVDGIMSIGSLEHYDDPLLGASEIARVLKPGGRACILLPNAYGLVGNVKHVAATGEVFDDRQPRQRYATRGTWEAMLNFAGLQADEVIGWGEVNRPRTRADWEWMVQRPQKFVRAALAAFVPVNLANQLIYLCSRSTTPRRRYAPTLPT